MPGHIILEFGEPFFVAFIEVGSFNFESLCQHLFPRLDVFDRITTANGMESQDSFNV